MARRKVERRAWAKACRFAVRPLPTSVLREIYLRQPPSYIVAHPSRWLWALAVQGELERRIPRPPVDPHHYFEYLMTCSWPYPTVEAMDKALRRRGYEV